MKFAELFSTIALITLAITILAPYALSTNDDRGYDGEYNLKVKQEGGYWLLVPR